MAPRPSDVKAVEALLLAEHPDVSELARSVIETLDALRADRETWAIVTVVTPGNYWARGPYPTRHQAERAISKGVGAADSARVGAMRVYPALSVLPEVVDPTAGCPRCRHPLASHNWPRSKVKGCVVGLPPSDPSKRPMPGTPARCDCEGDGR